MEEKEFGNIAEGEQAQLKYEEVFEVKQTPLFTPKLLATINRARGIRG